VLEARSESLAVRAPLNAARQLDRCSLKALQDVEHWPVLIVEQPLGDVHLVVRRNTNQIVIEGAVMNRTQAEPVRDLGSAGRIEIAHDVGCVEESDLLESADRALVTVGGNHKPAEAPLVEADLHFPRGVLSLERIVDNGWLVIVDRSDHAAG